VAFSGDASHKPVAEPPGEAPSLTVLLPTYNRARSLPRSIESVLAQTRRSFELLVSDNASDDDTQQVVEGYATRDARVRYHRQERNLGPIGNFNWLLGEARTEYVLMLADDDWLDADYLERCMALMEADPSLANVAGATRYYEGTAPRALVLNTELMEEDGAARVVHYLAGSWSSAAFYGLMRRSAIVPALPIPNVMGADWLFVAGVAYAGKVITTSDTHLNRARGGASASFDRVAEISGLSGRQARHPHLSIIWFVLVDIARNSRAYADMTGPRRLLLGLRAAAVLVRHHAFDLLWDTVGPLVLHRRIIHITGPLRDRWRERHPL